MPDLSVWHFRKEVPLMKKSIWMALLVTMVAGQVFSSFTGYWGVSFTSDPEDIDVWPKGAERGERGQEKGVRVPALVNPDF